MPKAGRSSSRAVSIDMFRGRFDALSDEQLLRIINAPPPTRRPGEALANFRNRSLRQSAAQGEAIIVRGLRPLQGVRFGAGGRR